MHDEDVSTMSVRAGVDFPDINVCPVNPTKCFDKVEEVVDNLNPFQSFFDSFFVSSPKESVEAALKMVWAVPAPDFDARWFRDTYQNDLMFIGIGLSIVMLLVSFGLIMTPWFERTSILDAFTDWMWTLFQMMLIPIFSSLVLLVSAFVSTYLRGLVDLEDPMSLLEFIKGGFLEVGWMSLLTRVLGTVLMIEVIMLYVAQTFATLLGAVITPLRSFNAAKHWYVRMIRGILLGFAPMIMTACFVLIVLVINNIDVLGSADIFGYAGVMLAFMAAIYLPLKISKSTKGVVTKAALRMADSRITPSGVEWRESASTASYERYLSRRQERNERRMDRLRDLAMVGGAIATGGTSAVVAATAASKTTTGQNFHRRAMLAKAKNDSFKQFREQRAAKAKSKSEA